MNKKIVIFIVILSLIFPLFPVIDITVFADDLPSVSDEQAYLEWLSNNGMAIDSAGHVYFTGTSQWVIDAHNNLDKILGESGYVVKDPMNILLDSAQSITGLQILDRTNTQQWAKDNGYPSISENIYDYSMNNCLSYAENRMAYYIYDFINVNDFFTYYNFPNYPSRDDLKGLNDLKDDLLTLTSDTDYVYFLNSNLQDINSLQYLYNTNLVKVPRSAFDDVYLTLYSGQFSGIQNYPFQSFRIPRDGSSLPSFPNFTTSSLRFYDGLEFSQSVPNISFYRFFGNASGDYYGGYESILGIPSYSIFTGFINNSNSWFSASSVGTAFLYSGETFSLPVFRSSNLISDFLAGESDVYKFNPSVEIPAGANIDYRRLFEEIQHAIAENSGNLIDSINNAANNYLDRIAGSLDDTNSILRNIYNLLDLQFPQIIDAIEHIQINGGSADMTQTNAILSQINEKLGILIDEPFADMDPEDFEDLRDMAGRKFPFCIFSDIVAISVILNQRPIEPDINIPLPVGSASVNTVHIDLTPYEYVRPYVHACIIFLFIIGLLALSVKVFESVKS